MLVLYKGIVNKIVVTLREFQSRESENFLFVFINDTTNEKIKVNLTDVSQTKMRCNEFCITTELMENFRPGFHHYMIYQNENGADTPEGLTLCEAGRLKVVTYAPVSAYETEKIITPVYGE